MRSLIFTKLCLLAFFFYCSTVHSQNWLLTGNTGTDTAVNFIGTKDGKALKFKVNNQLSGYLDYLASPGSTGFGYQALKVNTGTYNSAFGYQALIANTSGISNVALGYRVLNANTTGANNTAAGYRSLAVNNGSSNTGYGAFSLVTNTTGHDNTGIGYRANYSNTNGSNNTAIGTRALYLNTSGYSNVAIGAATMYKSLAESNSVAIGDSALFNDTSYGSFNTAIGSKTLYTNTWGFLNVAVGYQAMYGNTRGGFNTAVGYQALYTNSGVANHNTAIGYDALYANIEGDGNTAIGSLAMRYNKSGSNNVANGRDALFNNINGSDNIAIGVSALIYNEANGNIAIGTNALSNNTAGTYNTAIGYNANFSAANFSNSTAIGNSAWVTGNNQIMLGNTSVISVMAAGSYVIYSDGRFKRNVQANVPGLEFIKQLRPVTYNYNITGLNNYLGVGKVTQSSSLTGKEAAPVTNAADENAVAQKERKLYTGFVAQEVEEAAKKMNYDFSGVYHPQNDKDAYGLSYSEFVVPLIKAVQQLSDEADAKNARIDSLINQNTALEQRLAKIEAMLKISPANSVLLTGASIEQNAPNPFVSSTIIRYNLPVAYANASIVITDAAGKTLKTIALKGKGAGTVTVDANTMAAGAYHYTMYVDNKLVEGKQMLLSR